MTDRDDHSPATEQTESAWSKLLGAKFNRRGLGALVVAGTAAAGCTPKNTGAVPSGSESSSASASATAPNNIKTPFDKYYELVPTELKTRIESLKAKTSVERQQLSWEDQTFYAVASTIENELHGKYNGGFIDTKTGIGTNGDSLQDHALIRTPLSLESGAQDIWEQGCYFEALVPSMLTRDTQLDLVPLVAAEKSPEYDIYNKSILNYAPGDWGASQDTPTWRATQGDVYTIEANGKQVRRRDLTVTNPSNGKHFVDIFEFTAMPLLQYAAAAKDISINSKELGIWVQVSDHS
ncbi:MAG: hypothetical protein ACYC1E_03420 [Propionibacteriaceae bacterium]